MFDNTSLLRKLNMLKRFFLFLKNKLDSSSKKWKTYDTKTEENVSLQQHRNIF